MIKDSFNKIENMINSSKKINQEKKAVLLSLSKKLKGELGELAKTDIDQAKSVAHFTKITTHEHLRDKNNKKLLKLSNSGLKESIRDFEISHPDMTKLIDNICLILSDIGL
ncbi:MAG: DUF4404 family protein [bacterium]|nr:DUF4404 family protein [bacterium]